jgi:hypothetical protein
VEGTTMKKYQSYDFDNRDAGQMYDYLESRIEALKRRISELEAENEKLRWAVPVSEDEMMRLISA